MVVLAAVLFVAAGLETAPHQGLVVDACSPSGLDVQLQLDRAGFSPGEIDGHVGRLTRGAIEAFQADRNLPVSGQVDCATWSELRGFYSEPLVEYTIRPEDVAGPFVDALPYDLLEQAQLPALSYTSPIEALSEKFHVRPSLLKKLNPQSAFTAGETITVPNVAAGGRTPVAGGDVVVTVSTATASLTVKNADGKTLAYAPVTVGSEHDLLPLGTWTVTTVQFDPVFFYNPDLFWDADPTHSKAKIQPGPNNPVGVVWIDITKEHYGLHGTPEPSRIGRRESHGCVRMTNWDALRVARLVRVGTTVVFE